VGVVYCDAARMDGDGKPLPRTFIEHVGTVGDPPEGDLYETLLARNFLPAGSTLVRRECYEAVGPFDESLAYEDWDMWLRIARRYRFAFSPRIGVRYRVHPSSLTGMRCSGIASPEPPTGSTGLNSSTTRAPISAPAETCGHSSSTASAGHASRTRGSGR
jgi:hypothetical protein